MQTRQMSNVVQGNVDVCGSVANPVCETGIRPEVEGDHERTSERDNPNVQRGRVRRAVNVCTTSAFKRGKRNASKHKCRTNVEW